MDRRSRPDGGGEYGCGDESCAEKHVQTLFLSITAGEIVFTIPHCENACNAIQLGIKAIRLGLGVLRRLRVSVNVLEIVSNFTSACCTSGLAPGN